MSADPRVYRFDGGRLARNLFTVLPLAGFPVALALTGRRDPVLIALFAAAVVAVLAAVVYSAARFRLVVDAEGIDVRGRLQRRRLRWAEVRAIKVRRRRDRSPRMVGPGPYRELVLITDDRRLVVSSLPLGDAKFDDLIAQIHDRFPEAPLPG
jgi:hypothetical protein